MHYQRVTEMVMVGLYKFVTLWIRWQFQYRPSTCLLLHVGTRHSDFYQLSDQSGCSLAPTDACGVESQTHNLQDKNITGNSNE